MPLKIVIQLTNGNQLEYSARLWQGKVRYATHFQKMEHLVLTHFQLSQIEYNVKFIHGDEEEIITSIYKSSISNSLQSQEIQSQDLAIILSRENSGYHAIMKVSKILYREYNCLCSYRKKRSFH